MLNNEEVSIDEGNYNKENRERKSMIELLNLVLLRKQDKENDIHLSAALPSEK